MAPVADHQQPVHQVSVRTLNLTAFRSYDQVRLAVGPEPVVLTGPNGAG
ncbi:MAG: DNA replication and repair protein RecF, partial [Rhodospirillaceae bacterium]|nr:DNA replication and repair protein RecF [Rhodospirillaceae bacterium]